MPSKLRLDNLFAELRRLRSQRTWTEPRPVYVAVGLVTLAAMLMLVVVSSVKQPAVPVPTTPSARQEAPVEPVLRAEAPPPAAAPADRLAGQDAAPARPVAGSVRQAFGWQFSPLYGDWRYHPGVDLAAPAGGPVKAMWGGRVTALYEDRQYGLTVAVTGGGYTVYYGSLATAGVHKDQQVTAGAVVGTVGEAAGEPYPHLHLAVKRGDRYVDPQDFLAKSE